MTNSINNNSAPHIIFNFDPFDEKMEMPKKVAKYILSFLTANQLGNCCQVSKSWKALASMDNLLPFVDLKTLFPSLRIIDEKVEEEYVDLQANNLSFEGLTPLDKKKFIGGFKHLASLQIEDDAGFTLLTMPQNLSFRKAVKIARSQKHGYVTGSEIISYDFLDQFGDNVTPKSYRVLISNDILKCSRDKSFGKQQELVRQKGCEVPSVLEISALIVMSNMVDRRPLFSNGYSSWCLEQVNGYQMCAGSCSIFGSLFGFGLYVNNDPDRAHGIATLWKL